MRCSRCPPARPQMPPSSCGSSWLAHCPSRNGPNRSRSSDSARTCGVTDDGRGGPVCGTRGRPCTVWPIFSTMLCSAECALRPARARRRRARHRGGTRRASAPAGDSDGRRANDHQGWRYVQASATISSRSVCAGRQPSSSTARFARRDQHGQGHLRAGGRPRRRWAGGHPRAGRNDFADSESGAATEVVDAVVSGDRRLEGQQVGVGQVEDVDVVAHRGAVLGGQSVPKTEIFSR